MADPAVNISQASNAAPNAKKNLIPWRQKDNREVLETALIRCAVITIAIHSMAMKFPYHQRTARHAAVIPAHTAKHERKILPLISVFGAV
jgi:hypothetical protein